MSFISLKDANFNTRSSGNNRQNPNTNSATNASSQSKKSFALDKLSFLPSSFTNSVSQAVLDVAEITKLALPNNKFSLIDKNVIESLKKDNGLIDLLNPELVNVIDTSTISNEFINTPAKDLLFEENVQAVDFVQRNIESVISDQNKKFQTIEMPNVLSHEIIKLKNSFNFETNESSLFPSSIYNLKKDYFEEIQIPNASRYFLFSEENKLIRESYVENLSNTKKIIDRLYVDTESILNESRNIKVENNFGNKLVNFYLNENISSSIGKVASIILDNESIDFANIHKNSKTLNLSIANFFYTGIKENFSFLQTNENLSNVFEILVSINNSNSSYIKEANVNKEIINTDRIVGQSFLNLSVSLDGFFKDSLSYSYWNKKSNASERGGYLNNIIDSRPFSPVPIIKLDSILSIETNTDSLFNNFNNEIMNNLGAAFSIEDEEFKSNSLLLSQSSENYLNRNVFKVFDDSLYLTNELSNNVNYSYIFNSADYAEQVSEIIKNKEKFASQWSEVERANFNKEKYIKKYFNPMLVPAIHIKSTDSINSHMTLDYVISTYDSDVSFLFHSLPVNIDILRNVASNTEDFNTNKSRQILSGTKFMYFAGKSFDSRDNHVPEADGLLARDSRALTYIRGSSNPNTINKIKGICVETKEEFLDAGIRYGTGNSRITTFKREFIPEISIEFINSAKRAFFIKQDNIINKNYKNNIVLVQSITSDPNENDDSLKDFSLKQSLKNFFKGKSDESVFNNKAFVSRLRLITPSLEANKNSISLSKGFALFKNTKNEIPIDKLSDKFIKFDSGLTKENEFINDRLVKASSTFDQEKEKNSELIIDNLKQTSFNKEWLNIAFNLRHNLHKIKKAKLKRLNKTVVTDFLEKIRDRAKEIKKINKSTPYLTLLYSENSENSIDDFESSPFIFKNGSVEYFKKFDFSETKSNLKNSFDFLVNNSSESLEDFEINSSDLIDFLSFYYTNSELKNSSTLFTYFYTEVMNILTQYSSLEEFYSDIAYDKLLCDSIANDASSDVTSSLIVSALAIEKNISTNYDFEDMSGKTNGLYKKYLEKIYSYENIQRQKSYTLRTVQFPDIQCGFLPRIKNTSASHNPSDFPLRNILGTSTTEIESHSFDFGIMPGETLSYCFPFTVSTWSTNLQDEDAGLNYGAARCSAYVSYDSELYVVDSQKFDEKGKCEAMYEFVFSNFYNYDSYLDNSEFSRGQENNIKSAAFNKEKNIVNITNIMKQNKSDNNSYVLNKNTDYENLVKDFTVVNLDEFPESAENAYETKIEKSRLCYEPRQIIFEDYCLKRTTEHQPAFKTFINKFILEILKFIDSNFVNNFSKIDTIEDATKYALTFNDEINLITNLLYFPTSLFSIYFDTIVEGSIYKSLSRHLKDSERTEARFKDMWNKKVFDLININNLLSKEIIFEKTKRREENFPSSLFIKLHADLINIDKVLSNSDIAEVMSFDIMSSYLDEYKKFKSSSAKFDSTKDKISKLENELGVDNINSSLFNKTRLNLVSKKINDYSYFQSIEYNKINQIISDDLRLDLKDHFKNIIQNNSTNELEMFFSTFLAREKNKSILAEQGTSLLNLTNQRYDIIRFGIDYNLAENLLNNKILKIKCNIKNHKFPNIYIPPIYYFYTPVLTEITPSYLSVLEQSSQIENGIVIEDFIGVYLFDEIDLKQRYSVLSKIDAIRYIMTNLLSNINSERLFRGEDNLLSDIGPQAFFSAMKIVTDANLSNAVKYTNFKSQKNIDESNIKSLDSQVSVLGSLSSTLFETMTEKDFEETFSESYEKAINFFESEVNLSSKIDIIKNKAHFVEFFNATTEFIDNDKVTSTFDQNRFFDVFSIIIGRDEIKRQIESFYPNTNTLVNLAISEDSFFDSFSYIIESEVV